MTLIKKMPINKQNTTKRNPIDFLPLLLILIIISGLLLVIASYLAKTST